MFIGARWVGPKALGAGQAIGQGVEIAPVLQQVLQVSRSSDKVNTLL
jgi:hypothetical protein